MAWPLRRVDCCAPTNLTPSPLFPPDHSPRRASITARSYLVPGLCKRISRNRNQFLVFFFLRVFWPGNMCAAKQLFGCGQYTRGSLVCVDRLYPWRRSTFLRQGRFTMARFSLFALALLGWVFTASEAF